MVVVVVLLNTDYYFFIQSNNTNMKERGKSSSQTLSFMGVGYHMVNWLVILFTFFLFFSVLFDSFPWTSGCISLLLWPLYSDDTLIFKLTVSLSLSFYLLGR